MTGRARRVHFETDDAEVFIRRTRGRSSSRRRSRSAERVFRIHRIDDDNNGGSSSLVVDMQASGGGGRDVFDELLRELDMLRLELRAKDAEARQERERAHQLQRALDDTSDQDARRDTRLRDLRKKNARLEVQLAEAREALAQAGRQAAEAADWRRLYDEVDRRYGDASRRIDRLRQNADDHADARARLERENAALKRRVDRLEQDLALRRRQGY